MRGQFGGFTLDSTTRELLRGGEVVHLSPKAFQLLLRLVEERPKAISKHDLHQRLWPATFVTEANLATLIAEIRSALRDDAREPRFMRTVYGFGYAFSGEVEEVDAEQPRDFSLRTGEPTQVVPPGQLVASFQRLRRSPIAAASLALAFLILGGAGALSYFRRSADHEKTPAVPGVRTIAVLPFKSIGGEASDDYLGLGLADGLITRLSNVRQISVRPTSAVRKYAGVKQDSIAAGRELKVDAVLEGSIRKSAERMRVTVQLVSLRSGAPFWAETFDEKLSEMLTLEDAISERVAVALTLELTAEERKGLAKRGTENAEAHRLYVQGRYHYHKKTTEGWKKSLECFEEAIRLDPNYASAYSGVADIYHRLGEGIMPAREARPKAKAAALKALELDDSLPEAHMALANSLLLDWNWAAAESEFSRAIALRPIDGEAYQPHIHYLLARGRPDEAVAEGKRVLELNPVSLILNADYGNQLYLAGHYEEAISQLRKTLELDPNFAPAHARLGLVYLQVEKYDEAIAEFKKARALDNSPQKWGRLAILGYAYGISGRPSEARGVLDELEDFSRRHHVPPFSFALVHIGLGEKDQAFQWLEKSYAGHYPDMIRLKLNPTLDRLRSDPRFADLVRRVGIPN